MYGIKIFIFFWILVGAVFCLYALSTERIKALVNERPLWEAILAMMYAMIASPYWLIAGTVKVLFRKR